MAEVEISYKGSNIATMNASGTKTLLTEAKYLEDDVTVTYTRPAAPSGTKNISITQNGTTTEDVTAYASAEITANVPNTYSAGDEGKVVSNGALVAQGSDTVTTNDTYDTTLISSLTVNVSGGGGSIQVASGEIVVASDISSPSATASKTFPGLALDFVPDFLYVSMTLESYQNIASSSAGGHIYILIAIKKEYLPIIRLSNTTNTSEYSNDYRFLIGNSAYNSTDTTGYGVANAIGTVDSTRMAYWSVNNNGTLTYGRLNSTSQTAIYAGTYRYFAVKL